jgi:Cytochrome c7 and related cytochrome c/Class III cytochrome C family
MNIAAAKVVTGGNIERTLVVTRPLLPLPYKLVNEKLAVAGGSPWPSGSMNRASRNDSSRCSGFVKRWARSPAAMAAVLVAVIPGSAQQKPRGPEQPIAYSHKQHLALAMACKDCHVNPDLPDEMSLPASSKCMTCHVAIKKDSPAIQKLAAFDRDKKDIPWVRVYKLPDFVFFSHKMHLDAGAKCEECHGQVGQQDRLFREGDLSMAGCMSCHRERNAAMGCESCHEAR